MNSKDEIKAYDSKKISEKKIITRLDVNLEKIPFVSFYNYKNKKKIEDSIRNTKGGLEVFSQTMPDGSRRSIKLDVSMSYGLPVSDDQDVWVVVSHKLSEEHFKKKKFGDLLEIEMTEFARIMKRSKTGTFYRHIEESLNRLAGVSLFHNQCLFKKNENNEKLDLEFDAKKGLKIINSVTSLKIKNKNKRIKSVVQLEIPKWIKLNYINFYTTQLDIDFYFSLTKGRTRRLCRFLDIYRYTKQYFLEFNRCDSVLFLNAIKDRYKRNEKIRIALKDLKAKGYLEDFEFEDYGIRVVFSKVKKPYQKKLSKKFTKEEEDSLNSLLSYVEEPDSEPLFRSLIRDYTPASVIHSMDLTAETIRLEGVKKTKAAVFVYHIKKYGKKRPIV